MQACIDMRYDTHIRSSDRRNADIWYAVGGLLSCSEQSKYVSSLSLSCSSDLICGRMLVRDLLRMQSLRLNDLLDFSQPDSSDLHSRNALM